jgi:hypothetical protein
MPSFADELWISPATKSDWSYFARWHYRSHHVGLIRSMMTLWHRDDPVGICIFIAPPKSLAPRNRFFGRSGRWDRTTLRLLNCQLVMLSRVVLHPTFRGGGIAHRFVRRCCELCPYPWIETLTQMGHHNPFFERAGFIRVGVSNPQERSRETHSSLYGRRRPHGERQSLLTEETFNKSRFSNPVYYIFDNRRNCGDQRGRGVK